MSGARGRSPRWAFLLFGLTSAALGLALAACGVKGPPRPPASPGLVPTSTGASPAPRPGVP